MKKLFLLLILIPSLSWAGVLVSYQSNGLLTPKQGNIGINQAFGTLANRPTMTQSIKLYSVLYRTADPRDPNKMDVASGLLALPEGGAPRGVVIFYHGTTVDRSAVPSNFGRTAELGDASLAVLAFTSEGFAVVAPDYLGMGQSRLPVQPYPLFKANAAAGIDMLNAARSVVAKEGLSMANNLYVSGYSQGGLVAMWATKMLTNHAPAPFALKASAPLSGPYDLGATYGQFFKKSTDLVVYATRLVLVSYWGFTASKWIDGVDLDETFKPAFAAAIEKIFSAKETDLEAGMKVLGAANNAGANGSIQNLVTPDCWTAVKAHDSKNPLVRSLLQAALYNWTPKYPLFMVCVVHDQVVAADNTILTLSAMRKRGVASDTVEDYVVPDPKLTHFSGAAVCINYARLFFVGGFSNVPHTGG